MFEQVQRVSATKRHWRLGICGAGSRSVYSRPAGADKFIARPGRAAFRRSARASGSGYFTGAVEILGAARVLVSMDGHGRPLLVLAGATIAERCVTPDLRRGASRRQRVFGRALHTSRVISVEQAEMECLTNANSFAFSIAIFFRAMVDPRTASRPAETSRG